MRVIGLDISKSSTGVSIVSIDNKNLKLVDIFSIKPKKSNSFNKLHFYPKNLLIEELRKVFRKQECKFSVAFEFPIFSHYTSELQYYLTQEVLDLCYKEGVDIVGYSPAFLKKFVKLFVLDRKKYPPHLEKKHMRDIYVRYLYPLNRKVIPCPDLIKDDDSMDAFYLSILGSVLQSSFLEQVKDAIFNPITIEGLLNHTFDSLLLTKANYYRDLYLNSINDFKFNNFKFNDAGLTFGKQFKYLIKDSIVNNHLTLRSKMFFPFGVLEVLTCKMKVLKMENSEEFYEFWVKYLGTRRNHLKKVISDKDDFTFLFNKGGHYFIYPVENIMKGVENAI